MDVDSKQVKELCKTRFHFDLAGFPLPDQIHGLLRITDESRLLYGSDYPFTPEAVILRQATMMDEVLAVLFGETKIHEMYEAHAEELLNLQLFN